MEDNKHSAKAWPWPGHTTWVHIYVRFEDMFNTSVAISKTSFEQKEYVTSKL